VAIVTVERPSEAQDSWTEDEGFERRFREFHHANPSVYEELVRLTRQAAARGMQKVGIRMVWEIARWHFTVETKDQSSDFKMNDHYHSRYARLIMEQEKDLAGIFEVRQLVDEAKKKKAKAPKKNEKPKITWPSKNDWLLDRDKMLLYLRGKDDLPELLQRYVVVLERSIEKDRPPREEWHEYQARMRAERIERGESPDPPHHPKVEEPPPKTPADSI